MGNADGAVVQLSRQTEDEHSFDSTAKRFSSLGFLGLLSASVSFPSGPSNRDGLCLSIRSKQALAVNRERG